MEMGDEVLTIDSAKISSGVISTGALTANRITWEKPMVELEILCPICGLVVSTRVAADVSLEYSHGPLGSSTMRIEGAPVDLSAHLATGHTDAQWREAYFTFRPVDAVAKKSSGVAASAGTHGWRQV